MIFRGLGAHCIETHHIIPLFTTIILTLMGHRPNKLPWRYNEDAPGCVALKNTLAEQIASLVDHGYTSFLSGMALGVDCWCSQIVLDLREKNPDLKFHCLLPCEDQESKWPASSQKRYHAILEKADSIVYVDREYNDKCMLERDCALVQFSSLVLAVYDGGFRSGTGASGTRNAKNFLRGCAGKSDQRECKATPSGVFDRTRERAVGGLGCSPASASEYPKGYPET